ncbi:unnamed protein product [Bemisia tabaci]|uniref:SAYSvFN domain-containing protein n=1 Tax=Bemisia tabaci TaxID=7038 RepID=A0A9P0A687_BEMTA|nr:unnamed protein product [Bemisia tabaci]
MELEEKIAEYRARKRRGLLVKKVQNSVKDVFSWLHDKVETTMNDQDDIRVDENETDDTPANCNSSGVAVMEDFGSTSTDGADEYFINWRKFSLYVLLWCSLFGLAVFAEFGAVFVILSGFVIIWANTRTSPKKPGEISAYSVFNPNCEAIQGSLDAKQLEREMLYGGM